MPARSRIPPVPMSFVVISRFEDTAAGDLQEQGEAVAVFASEASAQAHFEARGTALASALGAARARDGGATFVTWVLLLRMPLEVGSVEEALEDLELVLEETDEVEDPFGELVVRFEGRRHAPGADAPLEQKDALDELEAWLT